MHLKRPTKENLIRRKRKRIRTKESKLPPQRLSLFRGGILRASLLKENNLNLPHSERKIIRLMLLQVLLIERLLLLNKIQLKKQQRLNRPGVIGQAQTVAKKLFLASHRNHALLKTTIPKLQ